MSIDSKQSIAYLTEDGWVLDRPREEEIKLVVKVHVKQSFMNRPWSVTPIERKSYTTDRTIKMLYEKYGKDPSGELDW